MKLKFTTSTKIALALAAAVLPAGAQAQSPVFSSGSDGSDGAINIVESTTLAMPDDGVFNATTINVAVGATLTFERNAANTPVYLLATGDVTIAGAIDVSGGDGASPSQPGQLAPGGLGGPGGFDGGQGAQDALTGPGAGLGPGGGAPGTVAHSGDLSEGAVGHGVYSIAAFRTLARPANGNPYGNPLLIPLVGGSGGGGTDLVERRHGGGGGGGAILIASDQSIQLSGRIDASGGRGGGVSNTAGYGSGGAIRLIAPVLSGNGSLVVASPDANGSPEGGWGRIRIDAIEQSELTVSSGTPESITRGSNMVVFPGSLPRLEIIEVAGQAIDPVADPITVLLPPGEPSSQPVKLRVTNFGRTAELVVVVTPAAGEPTRYEIDIENPGPTPAVGTVVVEIPPNVKSRIEAFTR